MVIFCLSSELEEEKKSREAGREKLGLKKPASLFLVPDVFSGLAVYLTFGAVKVPIL